MPLSCVWREFLENRVFGYPPLTRIRDPDSGCADVVVLFFRTSRGVFIREPSLCQRRGTSSRRFERLTLDNSKPGWSGVDS
eukprot:7316758-Prymnesium_polylepis.1